MEKAYCRVLIAPVRESNSDKSEMITQMLFGETCEILEVQNNFTKIKMDFDGYEGWLDSKQIAKGDFDKKGIVSTPFHIADLPEGKSVLSIGSEVDFEIESAIDCSNVRDSIVKLAKQFINVPYLWGGRSFFGIDCSGFTQLVYKVHGINILRDAYQQADLGSTRDFLEEAEPGDLAFFENEEGRIIHVGIVLESNQIIHAHGRVRIDTLDYSGIFNAEMNKHTHKLRFIKNIL